MVFLGAVTKSAGSLRGCEMGHESILPRTALDGTISSSQDARHRDDQGPAKWPLTAKSVCLRPDGPSGRPIVRV